MTGVGIAVKASQDAFKLSSAPRREATHDLRMSPAAADDHAR